MATVSTEKKIDRFNIIVAILDISIGGAEGPYIIKSLTDAKIPYNLTPRKLREYLKLISNLGLGYVEGDYCETTLKGIDFLPRYEDMRKEVKSWENSQ